MTAADRPPPAVTVTRPDGSRVEQRDVLAGAPERRPRRRLGPRGVACLVIVAVLLVGAAVTAGVQREREEQGRVALALLPTGGVESQVVWELTGRTALVRWRADVRNDGPRPVTVVRADLGALRDDPTPRELAPGERLPLSLTRIVRCVDPKGDPVPEALSVQVTTARGARTGALPVAPPVRAELDKAADRACGVLPLDEALAVRATDVQGRGETVVVAVEAANVSSRPLRLVRVVVAEGLGARALDRAGAPLSLPLELPPTMPGREAQRVQVQLALRVEGCPPPAALAPAEDLPAGALGFVVDGGPGTSESGPVLTALDDPAVQALDDQAC